MSAGKARIAGAELEYQWIDAASEPAPTVVFLHEGLGSVAMWREFPQRLCAEVNCRGLAYSRRGYGESEPVTGSWPVSFMHQEALEVLPAVLEHFDLRDVILLVTATEPRSRSSMRARNWGLCAPWCSKRRMCSSSRCASRRSRKRARPT